MSMDHIFSAALESSDSPFIGGTSVQFAWDSVSLTAMLACPRRYQYQILHGLVPKSPGYAIALVFGILFHKGLELYHKALITQDHDQALHTAIAAILALPATATLPCDEHIDNMLEATDVEDDDGITLRNSKIRTRYYLVRALVWYIDHFAEDPCTTILLPSGQPAVEVSFRVPLPIDMNGTPLLLCGHIDRGVSFNDALYVTDYKTSKSLTRQWRDMFELSHQMTGYTAAGKVIWDQPVRGAIVDGVALQVGQVRFGRHFTNRTDGQIGEYMLTLKYAAEQAQRHAETDYYPMNTSACYFCDHKDICSQPPEYREGYIRTHYHRKRGWNPLDNR